jgi:hypothetical protein
MDQTVVSALILTVLEEDLTLGVSTLKSRLLIELDKAFAAIEIARDEWLCVLLQLLELLLGHVCVVST